MTNGEKYKTAKERAEAFRDYCHDVGCDKCQIRTKVWEEHSGYCAIFWLDLPAPEEKPLPCPFCGEFVKVQRCSDGAFCYCDSCGYQAIAATEEENAIAAHNRVARAVMAVSKMETTTRESEAK